MTRTIEQQPPFDGSPSIFPQGNPNPPNVPSAGSVTPATGFTFQQSLGGVLALQQSTVYALFDNNTGNPNFYAFDPSLGFNDPEDDSFYTYRVEEISPGLVPTVRRLFISYTDLGKAQITCTIKGCTDAGAVVTGSQTVAIGNTVPTNQILIAIVDLAVTCLNPQLTIARAKNGGPISITKVLMLIEAEETTR